MLLMIGIIYYDKYSLLIINESYTHHVKQISPLKINSNTFKKPTDIIPASDVGHEMW